MSESEAMRKALAEQGYTEAPRPAAKKTAKGRGKRPSPGPGVWVSAVRAFIAAMKDDATRVTPNAQVVWHYMHHHADPREDMVVRQGVSQGARETGLAERTYKRAVAELVKRGFLVRLRRGQKRCGVSAYEVRGVPKSPSA